MYVRKSLRGLLAAWSRAPAARNSTAGTSTRSFCEAKLPKPVSEAPLQKQSLSDMWIEVYRRLWGEKRIVPVIATFGGFGGLVLFKNEITAAFVNDYRVYKTICRGNFCLPEEERRELVVREAPLKELKDIVQCTDVYRSYFVVTGPKGVGKSTLAKMASSGEKGVVLVRLKGAASTAEAAQAALVGALATAVGFSLPEKDRWDAVRDCFEDAGRAFSKELGRPATLVIDGVEFLSVDPALMKSLVTFAKTWADEGICRVVFITSAGTFLDSVAVADRGFTRAKFVHIRGMNKDEALTYLKQKGVWMDDRAAILDRAAQLVGDRFAWLIELGMGVASLGADEAGGESGMAWVDTQAVCLVEGGFTKAGLLPDNIGTDTYKLAVPALKELVRSPAATMRVATFLPRLLDNREDLLAALVANDIVSTVQGKVELQSRAAQFFVEQLPPPPPPPTPPTPPTPLPPWGWRPFFGK